MKFKQKTKCMKSNTGCCLTALNYTMGEEPISSTSEYLADHLLGPWISTGDWDSLCAHETVEPTVFAFVQGPCCTLLSVVCSLSLFCCWQPDAGNAGKSQNLDHNFAPTAQMLSVQMKERYSKGHKMEISTSIHRTTTFFPKKHDSK